MKNSVVVISYREYSVNSATNMRRDGTIHDCFVQTPNKNLLSFNIIIHPNNNKCQLIQLKICPLTV